MGCKKTTLNKKFYIPILEELKVSTNLKSIQNKLSISRQKLNYYLRQLKKLGLIQNKGKGWYEVVKDVKNSTQYGNIFPQDSIRGHAIIWEVELPNEIKDWDKRIEVLKNKDINYVLVGAFKKIPRIKVLGRKVWLCDTKLRIFDKENSSYYGENAIESRKKSTLELLSIINALENKLGFIFKPLRFNVKKEHFALIKNDLAKEHNKKGEQLHVSDKDGEWLLVDDSLGKGGELENIGKGSFKTNIQMTKWWNENKELDFQVTPKFILSYQLENTKQLNQLTSIIKDYGTHIKSHTDAIKQLSKAIPDLVKILKNKEDEIKSLGQRKLSEF